MRLYANPSAKLQYDCTYVVGVCVVVVVISKYGGGTSKLLDEVV
jgi:hypothetical protein